MYKKLIFFSSIALTGVLIVLFAHGFSYAQSQPCDRVTQAKEQLELGNFCRAFEIICPIKDQCPERAGEINVIYSVAKKQCPEYKDLILCPGSSSYDQEKATLPKPIVTPEEEPTGNDIAIYPLLFLDTSTTLESGISQEVIRDAFASSLPGINVTLITPSVVAPWVKKYDLRNVDNYLLHPTTVIVDLVARETSLGKLTPKYATALEALFKQVGTRYLLFVKATKESGEDHFSLWFCLYDASQPQKPILDETWSRIDETRFAAKRAKRFGEIVAEELR